LTAQALKPSRFPWFDYSRYSFSLGLKLGERTYLSGHSASEHDPAKGAIVVNGPMEQQARTAWAKIAAILDGGGQTLADVVRVVEYVTPSGVDDYTSALKVRTEVLGANRPAVSTVVVNSLLRPQALIEIEVTAGHADAPPQTPSHCGWPAARAAGDVVYLSSMLPLDNAGAIVGGDVAAQTRAIFASATQILAAFGLTLADVVKTVDYLTPGALPRYKETAQVRRDHFAPVFPAATGIIMQRVAHPAALIQVDFIASRRAHAAINPGWRTYEKLTYSPGVRAGDTLFLAGHAALDPDSGRVMHPGDIVAQAAYIYEKILQVIAAAGGGPEHLVKTIEYVTPAGLPRYREIGALRTRVLRQPLPAATGVVCEALLRPELQLEVDSLAILGQQ
jgi:enamine deaminase RidA (YjgF/YER057c/UK114 family)